MICKSCKWCINKDNGYWCKRYKIREILLEQVKGCKGFKEKKNVI